MLLYLYTEEMFALANAKSMIAETSFIIENPRMFDRLKHESIDRLYAVVDELPKYKEYLEELIVDFRIEDMLYLMNTIYRDSEFKISMHYQVYNKYFDEIEDLTHKYITC